MRVHTLEVYSMLKKHRYFTAHKGEVIVFIHALNSVVDRIGDKLIQFKGMEVNKVISKLYEDEWTVTELDSEELSKCEPEYHEGYKGGSDSFVCLDPTPEAA